MRDGVGHFRHEDLSIADCAGFGGLDQSAVDLLLARVGNHNLHLELRQGAQPVRVALEQYREQL